MEADGIDSDASELLSDTEPIDAIKRKRWLELRGLKDTDEFALVEEILDEIEVHFRDLEAEYQKEGTDKEEIENGKIAANLHMTFSKINSHVTSRRLDGIHP